MKKFILKILKKLGYRITNINKPILFQDIDENFFELAKKCMPFTMTSTERLYSTYKSVEYTVKNNIPGDYVECGVWKGGNSMMIVLTLLKNNCTDKKIFLYDTYEGMSKPSINDEDNSNKNILSRYEKNENDKSGSNWNRSEIEEAKVNLYSTGYPKKNLIFVKGKVEDTIPKTVPQKIAFLRLDTDFYESTKHELKHLYPILENKGVLIIDDYGHFQGCRKAVDEYFEENNINILLNRIDYTGRTAIKI